MTVNTDGRKTGIGATYAYDATGAPIALVAGGGFLRSKKIAAAMRPLDVALGPLNLVVMGDSTGNATDEWVYLTALAAASKYPAHTHSYRLWNDTSQQYDQPVTLATGTDGAAHVLTGSAATSWALEAADTAATSPAGDIDVRVKMNFNGTVFSAQAAIASKFGSAGNRTWRFEVTTGGNLFFEWSADGTTLINSTSTAAISGANLSADIWVRATLDVNNGAAGNDTKFYTSPDNSTWTQLGTTVTKAGTTSLFDSTSTTQFIGRGASSMAQQDHAIRFYECEVYASLDGTSRIVDIDVGAMIVTSATAGVTTFVDDVGNTITVSKSTTSGTFVGASRMAWFNSSTSGKAIVYSSDATRYPKQAVATPGIAFISYSHNEGTDVLYRPDYKTLTDKLLVTNPDICICAIAQNREVSPSTTFFEHNLRCRQIAEFAASQGFELIDVYSSLLAADTDTADGVHPTAVGMTKWHRLVANTLGLSST